MRLRYCFIRRVKKEKLTETCYNYSLIINGNSSSLRIFYNRYRHTFHLITYSYKYKNIEILIHLYEYLPPFVICRITHNNLVSTIDIDIRERSASCGSIFTYCVSRETQKFLTETEDLKILRNLKQIKLHIV